MLGKRKATMRRTLSVSLIGSGSVNGDSSPLPDHPKEKLKYSTPPGTSSCCAAPRQVIGFHPKGFADECSVPISPHRPPSAHSSSSSKSPSGSPRSGLGDLLAGARPWERKDEGVGLGIVAAFSSGSQEDDVCKYRDDAVSFGGSRKTTTTSPQAHGHNTPSIFAPSRASPPIPIHPASLLPTNSSRHSPSRSSNHNCGPAVPFGMAPTSFRPEPLFLEGNGPQSGDAGSRPSYSANGGAAPWARYPANAHSEAAAVAAAAVNWSQQADMELDRIEPHGALVYNMHHIAAQRQKVPSSSAGFSQMFLNACHLCKRRLGEGRDIYIYRGDKAFCSPECRHQQIMNDEQRPEKCAAAVMKVGGGGADARSSAQRSRVMAGGTATAAAA